MYSACWLIIIAAGVASLAWAYSIKNLGLAIIVIFALVALLYLCSTQLKEIVNDERMEMVREKASLRALQAFAIVGMVLSVVLISTQKDGSNLEYLGTILAYSVSALTILYSAFYMYYGKKYGAP